MTPILGIMASQISGHLVAPDLGSFFPIRSYVVPATAQSSVTFSSIPATYTHLQIRGILRRTSGTDNTNLRLGASSVDTGSNYAQHQLYGDATSAGSNGDASQTSIKAVHSSTTASCFAPVIIDILDYSNSNKNTTVKIFTGWDDNNATTGYMLFRSGTWLNTAAVGTISLIPGTGSLDTYSSFALYGVMA